MTRWLLCMTALGVGLTHGYAGKSLVGPSEPDALASGREGVNCTAAAEADGDDAWTMYCASLSPASRRARCAEQRAGNPADRESWCAAEWRNRPASNMGPWAARSSAVEPQSPRRCDEEGAGECCYSPIVIDVRGDGFDLTDAAHGVAFDVRGDGTPVRVGWTSPDPPDDTSRIPDDVWLALDRDGNGTIDNGLELFGNYSPQPPSARLNGFIALAVFDTPASGGNGDSKINAADRIFSSLRLWADRNQNGVSEPAELFGLAALGVAGISLEYQVSRIVDEHGNEFRYRASVYGAPGSRVGPFAYDVFLVAQETAATQQACGGGSCSCTGVTVRRVTSPPPPAPPSPCNWPWCYCDRERALLRYRCTANFNNGASKSTGVCIERYHPTPDVEARRECRQFCDSHNGGVCPTPSP